MMTRSELYDAIRELLDENQEAFTDRVRIDLRTVLDIMDDRWPKPWLYLNKATHYTLNLYLGPARSEEIVRATLYYGAILYRTAEEATAATEGKVTS